jgi:hypothetical protein
LAWPLNVRDNSSNVTDQLSSSLRTLVRRIPTTLEIFPRYLAQSAAAAPRWGVARKMMLLVDSYMSPKFACKECAIHKAYFHG